MALKAIVTVQWSDVSDTGESICVEDDNFSITPLHANLNRNMACFEAVSDDYTEMLDNLISDNKLDIDPDALYHTIFEVSLNYSEDYYGEVGMDYTLNLIDHEKVGEFDEDNNLTYTDEKIQSSVDMITLGV